MTNYDHAKRGDITENLAEAGPVNDIQAIRFLIPQDAEGVQLYYEVSTSVGLPDDHFSYTAFYYIGEQKYRRDFVINWVSRDPVDGRLISFSEESVEPIGQALLDAIYGREESGN